MLKEFVDRELQRHLPLVVAAGGGPQAPALAFPTDWAGLEVTLRALAYHPGSEDPWRLLGVGMLHGPMPSSVLLSDRSSTALLLCEIAGAAGWEGEERARVQEFAQAVRAAASDCERELRVAVRERKRSGIPDLSAFKELGARGREAALHGLPEGALDLTAWSRILAEEVAMGAGAPTAAMVDEARRLSALAERGDPAFWPAVAGRVVVMWAPEDRNAFSRVLADLLRAADPAARPESIRMVSPIRLVPGMTTPEAVSDYFWHPLLGARYLAVARRCRFVVEPMSMVSTGPTGPRQEKSGLALFDLDHQGQRQPPEMLQLRRPLIGVDADPHFVVDTQTTHLFDLLACLDGPALPGLVVRQPARSPLSTKESPRVAITIYFPRGGARAGGTGTPEPTSPRG